MSSLRNKALSERIGTVCSAIAEMIQLREFALSETDLRAIESRNDEQLCGWVFAYRAVSATPEERTELLRSGIRSTNPRVREQACDIIGDHNLAELRMELQMLFTDPVHYVAEAARYNHDEILNT
jgi:hypothetical protein